MLRSAGGTSRAPALLRLLVVPRLQRRGGLDTDSFGDFPVGEVVGVAVAAHDRAACLPGVPGCGGLLPALVGELPSATRAHGAPRLLLSGTALFLRRGCRRRLLRQLIDGAGTERPDSQGPPSFAQLGQRPRLLALRRARPVGGLLVERIGGPFPRRVPLPLFVVGYEGGHHVRDLLASGRLPADEPLAYPDDLHDRALAGRHLARFPHSTDPQIKNSCRTPTHS